MQLEGGLTERARRLLAGGEPLVQACCVELVVAGAAGELGQLARGACG